MAGLGQPAQPRGTGDLKLAAAQCWEGSGWACSAALLQALPCPLGKDEVLAVLVGAREKGAVLYVCSSAASVFCR